MTKGEVRQLITQLPQIQAKINRMGITWMNYETLPENRLSTSPLISFELHDLTLREILNYMIGSGNSYFWIVARSGPNNEYITVDF
jgi:hypothetical protein